MKKNDNLPVDHHCGHKVDSIVFILGKNIANCKTCHMEEDRLKLEIKNDLQKAVIIQKNVHMLAVLTLKQCKFVFTTLTFREQYFQK